MIWTQGPNDENRVLVHAIDWSVLILKTEMATQENTQARKQLEIVWQDKLMKKQLFNNIL